MDKARRESIVTDAMIHGGERALSVLTDSTTSDRLRDRLIKIHGSVLHEIHDMGFFIDALLQQLSDASKIDQETVYSFERNKRGDSVFDAIDESLAKTRELAVSLLDALKQSTYLRLKLKDVEENLEKLASNE